MAQPELAVVKLDEIRENPVALRAVNRQSEGFKDLTASIKREGVLNPINIRRKDGSDGKKYELIDGLHRFSASLEAGLTEIPAQIIDRNDADVMMSQIIGNVQRVETRPAEYAQGLRRILGQNPLMTEAELATTLSKSPAWIGDQLGLTKLTDPIAKLVNEGRIALSNAYALSKLPADEQPNWLERAMTTPAPQFGPQVLARKKEIDQAARKGRDAAPESFVAVMHLRKKSEIEEQLKAPTLLEELLRKNKVTDPIEAAKLAVAWTLNFDPESQAAQKAKYDAEKAAQKEQAERRKAEREAKKLAEAKDTAANATAGTPAPTAE